VQQVEVLVQGQSATSVPGTWQAAGLGVDTWSINYTLPPEVADPTGIYTVTVAAQTSQPLKEITLYLDDTPMQTLAFAESEAVTRILHTVTVNVTGEGPHTL
jgi:hypothetical protein